MIKLIIPEEKYLDSYKEAIKEYKEHHVDTYFFTDPEEENIFEKFYNSRNGIHLKPGRVASTTFWLVSDNEFIGEISLRHELTDALMAYGGHVSYGVRYSKWGQGYGRLMLAYALEEAKKLGLERVLITCDDDNIGSAKVMEHNGGILENKVENIIGGQKVLTRRYWIDIK